MSEHDAVDHPRHYTSDRSGVECIQITRHRNFNIGNAIKYLWRQGLKESASTEPVAKQIEDLEKARWYIADEITRLQGEGAPQTDREKAEGWIAAVDAEEAGYAAFGEHLEGFATGGYIPAPSIIDQIHLDHTTSAYGVANPEAVKKFLADVNALAQPTRFTLGGGDALSAKINLAAAANEHPTLGYIVGLSKEGAPQAGDPAIIRRINFVPPAEHLAPVTDLTARRNRTRIHSSPCTCSTNGTVA